MKLTERETAELYREMTARGQERNADCLDEDLLVRASAGDLTAGERERIAAHIARCSDCAREYRIARSMAPFRAETTAALRSRAPQWWAIAAAVVVAVIIGGYGLRSVDMIGDLRRQVIVQRQELDQVRRALAAERARPREMPQPPRPQLGVPIVDLDSDVTRGPGTPIPSVVVSQGTDEFTLVLHFPEGIRAPAQIELAGAKEIVWRDTIAGGIDSGATTLSLHRSLVPAGSYSIRVRSGKRQVTFPFRVTYR